MYYALKLLAGTNCLREARNPIMRRLAEQKRGDEQVFWFQDNRTGCEKQASYFERMRYLQAELVMVEQKNLISAMERLEQLKYPRRKPVIFNYVCPQYHSKSERTGEIIQQKALRGRCERLHNERAMSVHTGNQQSRGEISYLSPTSVAISTENKRIKNTCGTQHPVKNRSSSKIQGPHSQQKPERDRVITNLIATDARSPLPGVLFPSLPCIPNVGHRTHIEEENKLKMLELACAEFQNCGFSAQWDVSRGRKGLLPKARKDCSSRQRGTRTPPMNCHVSQKEKDVIEYEGNATDKTQLTWANLKSEKETKVEHANSCEEADKKLVPPPTRVNSRHQITRHLRGDSPSAITFHFAAESIT